MRTIKFLLQKEFLQIIRNKSLMASMLIGPIIQLLILPLAANYEVKHILLAVVDHDRSTYSQKLVTKILSSGYFVLAGQSESYGNAMSLVEQDKADLVLEIPAGFERNLIRERRAETPRRCERHQWHESGAGSGISRKHHHRFQLRPATAVDTAGADETDADHRYRSVKLVQSVDGLQ